MIVASRLCRPAYAAFDSSGGLDKSGRWHERGYRVVYASGSEALATLEVLVHLSLLTQIPEYVCVKARIPEDLVVDVRDFGLLPADWASTEQTQARALGTRWIVSGASAVLCVPSAVIPREPNYMLNPEHPDFQRIAVDAPLPFEFDVRLILRAR